MATRFVLFATQFAVVTANPCHPLDGHEHKIYVHGYVGNLKDRQAWVRTGGPDADIDGGGRWLMADGENKVDAASFFFKGVTGFCNQYKLQDKSKSGNYWVSFVNDGYASYRAYYDESGADPIQFEDAGNGEYVLKSAWQGYSVYMDDYMRTGSESYFSYSQGITLPSVTLQNIVVLSGYYRSSAMVVSLEEPDGEPEEMAAHPTFLEDAVATKTMSADRTTPVAAGSGFFVGVAMITLSIYIKTSRSRAAMHREPLLA